MSPTAAVVSWTSSAAVGASRRLSAMRYLGPLVSALEVKNALLASPGSIRCLDASWHLGGHRDARKEFAEGHIPGAAFFDIDGIADKSSSLPHMYVRFFTGDGGLPSEDLFSSRVSDLGISNDHTVVVYAAQGSFSAPRCWWTFRAFGHSSVHVLDGGLPAWQEVGGAIEQGEVKPESTRPSAGLVQPSGNAWKLRNRGFQAKLNAPMLRTWRQVLGEIEQGPGAGSQIVDARSMARFRAEAPEPRPGVAGGHMPGAVCLPFTEVLVEGNVNRFRPPAEIREKFEQAGVDVDSPGPITTTCGSGVSAAVLAFALELTGRKAESSPVYDGSWAEWGSRDDLPRQP